MFFDTFVGVDGTALAAHTPNVGGPWVDDVPGWKIENNAAEQKVNAALSHFQLSQKTVLFNLVFDMNGADNANFISIYLGDDPGTTAVILTVTGTGFVEVIVQSPGNAFTDNSFQAGTLDPALPHTLQMRYGPDLLKVNLDGSILEWVRRFLPKTFLFTRVQILTGGLNAKPGPRMLQVSQN